MDTNYIAEFIKIAQMRSFSGAAEELLISQSSLSKHIKTLETQLGQHLFDRTTRSVSLTTFGQDILSLCEELNDKSNAILKLADNQATRNRNHLLITSIPVMAQYNITGIIASFLNGHPEIHLTFTESESLMIKHLLSNGTYELAFTRIIEKNDPLFESIPYYSDQLVAVLPKTHRLARNSTIDIKELLNDQFLFLDENTMLHGYLTNLCKENGFTPNIVQTAHRPENIIDFVSKGLGISLLYRKQVEYVNNPNIAAIDIHPIHTSVIALSKLKSHKLSHAATIFWNYIKLKKYPT